MAWRAADIPDQRGRVAIVTGANSGLGLATARELARAGARVLLAVRDLDRGEEAATEIRLAHPDADVECHRLDLADLGRIRDFCEQMEGDLPEGLDLLINNAGVMAPPRRQTADGFELQIGTNHLGHFALTGLLIGALSRRPGARVVTVSSAMHRLGRIDFDDLQSERSYSRWGAYGQSKLANLLFAFELQRRADAAGPARYGSGFKSMAAHPGYAATHLQSTGPAIGGGLIAAINTAGARLGNVLIGQSAEAGALPSLFAAVEPDLPGATFVGPSNLFEARGAPHVVTASGSAYDEPAAARLWRVSEQLTGVEFPAA